MTSGSFLYRSIGGVVVFAMICGLAERSCFGPRGRCSVRAESPSRSDQEVDLRPRLEGFGLKPEDQGRRDTCSLFAMSGLAEFEVSLARASESGPLSPEYLVWAANEATGLEGDRAMFHDAILGLRRLGICRRELMGYRKEPGSGKVPSEDATRDGKRRTHWTVRWIKRWDVRGGLSEEQRSAVKRELVEGHPVAVGLRWPKELRLSEDHVLETPPSEEVFDGHSVLFVGFREDRSVPGGGTFLFRNSAGPRWGDRGYARLSYEYVSLYANDAVALRAGRDRAADAKPPSVMQVEDLEVVRVEKCRTVRQPMAPWGEKQWGNGTQVFVQGERGSGVEFEFGVARTGSYRIEIDGTCAPDFGIVQVWVDKKRAGVPVDFYAGRVLPWAFLDLGTFRLRTGRHRLRFTAVGKNDLSSNYSFGVDAIRLIPIP